MKMSKHERKIQTVVICGLLLLSLIDICECAKTKGKSKSGSATTRPKVANTQHVNPGSLSYSGISPNAPQQVKPSAPKFDQKPSQVNYPQTSSGNVRPVGWDINSQQRPQPAPYPVNSNQQRPQSPPYPVNQPQHNTPLQNSPYPQHSPPVSNVQSQYNPQPAYNPQPVHNSQSIHNPQAGYNPQQGYNPQPAHNPQQGYHPQQGYNPQPAYNPQQGYNPQPGYNPQQGYNQQPVFNSQPQVVHHMVPVQQQSSGPGLLKTAVIGGAAGLGTAYLYDKFSSKDDPKTTVIIVNNTQSIQPEVVPQQPAQVNQASAVPIQPIQEQSPLNVQQNPIPEQLPQNIQQNPIQEYPTQVNQASGVPIQPIQEQSPLNVQQNPIPEQLPQNIQQNPIQEQSTQLNQDSMVPIQPIQEQSQITVQNVPLNMVENQTMIPILAGSTAAILENQSAQQSAIQSEIAESTVTASSSPDKVFPPVDSHSSRATESANLNDSMSSNQPMNTQLSIFIFALSCSFLYLVQ